MYKVYKFELSHFTCFRRIYILLCQLKNNVRDLKYFSLKDTKRFIKIESMVGWTEFFKKTA